MKKEIDSVAENLYPARPSKSASSARSTTLVKKDKADIRRWLLLIIGVVCLSAGLYFHFIDGSETGGKFASNSILRIGIVLVALWLALPTLKKPLSWLPPGIVAACLVGIGVIAAQPKLIFVIGPAAGVLIAVAGVARMFRRR